MNKDMFKYKNMLSNGLIGISLFLFLAGNYGLEWMKRPFTSEMAIGILFVAIMMKMTYVRSIRNEDYKNEVLTKEQDERLIIEKLKRDKIISSLLTYELMIMVAISVYRDFSFNLGGLILLWSLIVFWIGVKILEGIKTRR